MIQYIDLQVGKKIESVGKWKEILEYPEVVHAQVLLNEGHIIKMITDSAKRPGFVIVKGDTRDKAIHFGKMYAEMLKSYIILN